MISAGGILSGLDTESIINQLTDLEKINQDPVQRSKAAAGREKTAILELNTKLTSFLSSLGKLDGLDDAMEKVAGNPEVLTTRVSNSDEEALSVESTAAAVPGVYTVAVTNLASAARRDHAGVTDSTTALSVGDGVFAFSYAGGDVQTIDITGGETTLDDLRNAINDLDGGVRATIIDTGVTGANQYRLVLDGEDTGLSNTIVVDGTTTLAGFDEVDFGTTAAADAQMTINGIAIQSESNTVEPLEGLTLELFEEGGDPVTITVSQDVGALRTKLEDLASKANEVIDFLKSQARYDPTTRTAGTLSGDSLIQSIEGTLRSAFSTTIETTGPFRSLADLGFSLDSAGRVEIDSDTLTEALESPKAVRDLLQSTQPDDPEGLGAQMRGMLTRFASGDDSLLQLRVGTLEDRIESLDDRLLVLDARAERYRSRLEKQFAALEQALAGISSTQQFFANNKIGIY